MLIRKEFKVHIRHDPPKQITAGSGGKMSEANQTEPQLKPCPFCGSESAEHGNNMIGVEVYCPNHSCPAQPNVSGKNRSEVYPAWNHRQPEVQLLADRDALLDALIELRDDTPPASSSLRKKIEAVITSVEQHQTRRLGSW